MARIRHLALTTDDPEKVAAFYMAAFRVDQIFLECRHKVRCAAACLGGIIKGNHEGSQSTGWPTWA